MPESPQWLDELQELTSALVDDQLRPEQRDRLVQILRGNPEAQVFYRNYLAMHVALEYRFGMSASVPEDFPETAGAGKSAERLPFSDAMILPSLEDLPANEPPAAVLPSLPFVRLRKRTQEKTVRRSFPWWGRIAAVIVVAACATLAILHNWNTPQPAAPPDTIAKITDQVGARWTSALASESLVGGEHLQLAEGFIELTFQSGAKLVVQSPADLTVEGKSVVVLTSGTLAAHVDGGGFVVKTPTAVVNDLGTEFGIRIGPDRATRVEVFQGKVEASISNAVSARQMLTVGQAADVSEKAVRVDPLGVRPESFVRTLNAVIVRGSLVADLRPDVVPGSLAWSNHATGSASVGDFAAPGGQSLSLEKVDAALGSGDQLNGVWLGEARTPFLRSARDVPALLAGANNVSVEAWVKVAGKPADFRTVAYWGKPDVGNQRAFLVGQISPFVGFYADVNGWGNQAVSTESWQHVVWTYDQKKKEMIVYLNGRQANSAKLSLTTAISPIALGARVISAQGTASADPLNGCVAAFRVHTGILEADDVRHNFIAGIGNMNRITVEK